MSFSQIEIVKALDIVEALDGPPQKLDRPVQRFDALSRKIGNQTSALA